MIDRCLVAILISIIIVPTTARAEDDDAAPAPSPAPTPGAEPVAADPHEPEAPGVDKPPKRGKGHKNHKGKRDKDPQPGHDGDDGETAARGMGGEEDIEGDGKLEGRSPVTIGGRVFARGELVDTDVAPWTGQMSLASARLGASYRWKDRLRVKAVVEAAGKNVKVRDAFVETSAGGGLQVRAGRFKVPVSALERESAWRLPTIDRGAVAVVLEDGIGLTGRRNGAAASWAALADRVRVTAAASQSAATTGDEPARDVADGAGVSVSLRGEVASSTGVRVGVVGSNREVNYVADVGRYWAAGLDAEIDLEKAGLGLRLWADVLVGTSHLGASSSGEPTRFVAAQAVAGWRFGGAKKGKRYVEPYALGAYFNPDTGHRRDDLTDVIVGVAAGRWKRWRVQAQLSVADVKANRPAGLGGFQVDVDDRTSASVQLGAAF